ncbi:MAG: alkaline shock response membrane anchor protein AmaP [Clostridia bacterium]|nr:alkaline shock response membrane anchor protein AmaP [Clostridia bacterium]
MKKSIPIRVLTALSGLLLVTLSACVLAEAFFRVPVTEVLSGLLGSRSPLAVLGTLVIALALLALGAGCLCMLLPHRKSDKRGFVMQKTENGPIGISIRAIEGLVQSCVQQHEAIAQADVSIAESRDGIVILLNIDQAAGVNIPLSVGALQKQIRQYVTACTGVDVQEVRVMVENNAPALAASPYAVQETAPIPAAPVMESYAEAPAVETAAEIAAPAAPAVVAAPVAAPPVMTTMPVMPEEDDDRPLHQRLFGTEDEPAIVPAPPELMMEAASGEQTERAGEEAAEDAAEEPAEVSEAEETAEVCEEPVQAAQTEEMDDNAQQADDAPVDE